ncbi:MAG: hypothetical protein ACI9NQ_001190 [Paracoccaceae bacterium]|jgi:hypothetical protein
MPFFFFPDRWQATAASALLIPASDFAAERMFSKLSRSFPVVVGTHGDCGGYSL